MQLGVFGGQAGEEMVLEGNELGEEELRVRMAGEGYFAVVLPIRDLFGISEILELLLVSREQQLHVLERAQIGRSAPQRAAVAIEREIVAIAVGGNHGQFMVSVSVGGVEGDGLLVEGLRLAVGVIARGGVLKLDLVALQIAQVNQDKVSENDLGVLREESGRRFAR